jgi:hypothetical protein
MAREDPARDNLTATIQGNVSQAAALGNYYSAGLDTIDLRTLNDTSLAFPVQGLIKFSARVQASAWGSPTAVVEVKRSVDGANADSFGTPITINDVGPAVYEQDTDGAAFLIFEVTTLHAAADQTARLYVYGYRP